MNDQPPMNRNPLDNPEILANVFSYLPTACLAKLTYVNKMWRLEARYKLYQYRSKIIYRLVKKQLTTKLSKFRLTFDLDMRVELFSIRDQLQKKSDDAKAEHMEKLNACAEACKIFRMDPRNIDKHVHYRKLNQEFTGVGDKNFHAYKRLVDFEYYLLMCGYITDPDEVDDIFNKGDNLCEWEESRGASAANIEGDTD